MLPVMFHALSLAFYVFLGKVYFAMKVPPDLKIGMPDLKENWWQFFTCWNLGFQVAYFSTSAAIDVLNLTPRKVLEKEKQTLRFARDLIFQSLVVPCALTVFAVFWVLFAYDRRVIFPVEVDVIVPWWLNHCIHTTIIFFAVGELLIRRRPFCNLWSRFLFGMVVMLMYNVTVVLSYHWQGFWTYPIMGLLSGFHRIVYFCCMYLIYSTAYALGCIGNSWICGKDAKREGRHGKRS